MKWKHDTIIGPDGSPYMRRWVLEARWFTVRLHHILREDYDCTTFHDHPWDFVSVLLKGAYSERRPGGDLTYRGAVGFFGAVPFGRRLVAFRPAEALHRITWVPKGGAWTLVFTGPRRRQWGFVDQDAWVCWRAWVKAKHGSVKAAYA